MKHLWSKLESKPKEWRRIFKALNAMDYLVKNGAPRCIQDVKDDLYKIRSLQDFNYKDGDEERGGSIRDKAKEICQILSDPQRI
jgi:epsin